MGFFDTMGKIFMGQSLGPSAPTDGAPPSAPVQSQGIGIVDQGGHKIIPEIEVKNVRSHHMGEKLIVKAYIFNKSPDQIIRVDTTYMLKQKRQHNQEIGPGRSWELTFYDGPAVRDENEHHAQIMYRLKVNGDTFMENYQIRYSLESDGSRIVEGLHDEGPARDI